MKPAVKNKLTVIRKTSKYFFQSIIFFITFNFALAPGRPAGNNRIINCREQPKRSNDAENGKEIKNTQGKSPLAFCHFSAEGNGKNYQQIYQEHEKGKGLGVDEEGVKIGRYRREIPPDRVYDKNFRGEEMEKIIDNSPEKIINRKN